MWFKTVYVCLRSKENVPNTLILIFLVVAGAPNHRLNVDSKAY